MGYGFYSETDVGGGILADGVVDFFHKRGDVLVIAAGYADLRNVLASVFLDIEVIVSICLINVCLLYTSDAADE